MHFAGCVSFIVSGTYLAALLSIRIQILALQDFEKLKFGRCNVGRQDIIRLVDTVHTCFVMCKRRPACKAYSFHRHTGLCRLHTELGVPNECSGYFYSEKQSWDATAVNGCTCKEGEVCVPEENGSGFVTCEIKECILPNNPTSGKILGNEISVGRHIRYDCNKGYIASTESVRECQQNGIWSGIEPKCEPQSVCPVSGSTQWGQSCYLIVTATDLKNTFADAETYCEEGGGHMIHVTSQSEHDYISSELAPPGNPAVWQYWVGVKLGQNGAWYLSDNVTAATFLQWGDNEPRAGKYCAVYNYIPEYNAWKWLAKSCTEHPKLPICEYDLVS